MEWCGAIAILADGKFLEICEFPRGHYGCRHSYEQAWRPTPPDYERPCGCRTEQGIFIACSDHCTDARTAY